MEHAYTFLFDCRRYTVQGSRDSPPEFIVLPDRRVVRVMAFFETFPPQIARVALVDSGIAVDMVK